MTTANIPGARRTYADGYCFECGGSARLDKVSGVCTHTSKSGNVDHDLDADHVPRLDVEHEERKPRSYIFGHLPGCKGVVTVTKENKHGKS